MNKIFLIGMVLALAGCSSEPYVSPQDRLMASMTPKEIQQRAEADAVCRSVTASETKGMAPSQVQIIQHLDVMQKDICEMLQNNREIQLCLYSKTESDIDKYCTEEKAK